MSSMFGTRGLAGAWNDRAPVLRAPFAPLCLECRSHDSVPRGVLCEGCLRVEVHTIGELVRNWRQRGVPKVAVRPLPRPPAIEPSSPIQEQLL